MKVFRDVVLFATGAFVMLRLIMAVMHFRQRRWGWFLIDVSIANAMGLLFEAIFTQPALPPTARAVAFAVSMVLAVVGAIIVLVRHE